MSTPEPVIKPLIARRYTISGRVQGVGFRPFIYQLAKKYNLQGWVQNSMGQVIVHAQARQEALDNFTLDIIASAPPAAEPRIKTMHEITNEVCNGFSIRASELMAPIDIHLVADLPTCKHCRQEMLAPGERRYRYPFINCAHCGPRYSLIKQLPYDRRNTSMANFKLCQRCQADYEDPANRRFHAEPVACEECGPHLSYTDNKQSITGNEQSLKACIQALAGGLIMAVKGIGGYHLMCDASNAAAISRLRARKHRPDKPLAVMVSEEQLGHMVNCHAEAKYLLTSRIRPIVLLAKRTQTNLTAAIVINLAPNIAPNLSEIGVMLPYSPLHELIIAAVGPVIMTSANMSGEPVLTRNDDAMNYLGNIADGFLHHNRDIQRPVEDPVYRFIDNKPRPIRLGRGNAPVELKLPFTLAQPVLATGGQMKNTLALAWDDRIVISPHIGDLNSLRSQQTFEQMCIDLQALYRVKASTIICDAHHGYASSRWARNSGLPVTQVAHHYAHAAVLCGESPLEETWLVFTWDGTGLGPDQQLWGGEALWGRAGNWQRVASMRTFKLPGGDRVAREPWRSAASLCWGAGMDWQPNIAAIDLLHQAWRKNINCPTTTAVGRLFDAAAALVGLLDTASYEGQGPMQLESIATGYVTEAIDLALQQDRNQVWRTDWSGLLPMLLDEQLSVAQRASCFHISMAQALVNQAKQIREARGDFCVGLSGGVFQNKLLTEQVAQLLTASGFRYRIPLQVPVNDAGLCYGQVIEAQASNENL